jgi:hypothetical protein
MRLGPYHVDPEASECVGRDEFEQFKVRTQKQILNLKRDAERRDYKIKFLETSQNEMADEIKHLREKNRKFSKRVNGLENLENDIKVEKWRTKSSSNPYSTDDNRGYSPGSDTEREREGVFIRRNS